MENLNQIEKHIGIIPPYVNINDKLNALYTELGDVLLNKTELPDFKNKIKSILKMFIDVIPYQKDDFDIVCKLLEREFSEFRILTMKDESIMMEYLPHGKIMEYFNLFIENSDVTRIYSHFHIIHTASIATSNSISTRIVNLLESVNKSNIENKLIQRLNYTFAETGSLLIRSGDFINHNYIVDELYDIEQVFNRYIMSWGSANRTISILYDRAHFDMKNCNFIDECAMTKLLNSLGLHYRSLYEKYSTLFSVFINTIFKEIVLYLNIETICLNIETIYKIIEYDIDNSENSIETVNSWKEFFLKLLSIYNKDLLTNISDSLAIKMNINNKVQYFDYAGSINTHVPIIKTYIIEIFSSYGNIAIGRKNTSDIVALNMSAGSIPMNIYEKHLKEFIFSPFVSIDSVYDLVSQLYGNGFDVIENIIDSVSDINNISVIIQKLLLNDMIVETKLKRNDNGVGRQIAKDIINNNVLPSPKVLLNFLKYYNDNVYKFIDIKGYHNIYKTIIMYSIESLSYSTKNMNILNYTYDWKSIIDLIVDKGDPELLGSCLRDLLNVKFGKINMINYCYFIKRISPFIDRNNISLRIMLSNVIHLNTHKDSCDIDNDTISHMMAHAFNNTNINNIHQLNYILTKYKIVNESVVSLMYKGLLYNEPWAIERLSDIFK